MPSLLSDRRGSLLVRVSQTHYPFAISFENAKPVSFVYVLQDSLLNRYVLYSTSLGAHVRVYHGTKAEARRDDRFTKENRRR